MLTKRGCCDVECLIKFTEQSDNIQPTVQGTYTFHPPSHRDSLEGISVYIQGWDPPLR